MSKINKEPIESAILDPVVWQNRIVRYGEESPAKLIANEKNWRTHPKAQLAALEGALIEVGVVQSAIVNLRTHRLAGGHHRGWAPIYW
jgi:hypothetical protein